MGKAHYICMYVYVYERVDISMLVIGDASDVMRYNERTRELSNAPLRMK